MSLARRPRAANALARLTPASGPPPRIPLGLAAVRGGFGPVRGRKAAAARSPETANALARLTLVSGPHHLAPGHSRALRDCHAERVSAGAYGSAFNVPTA